MSPLTTVLVRVSLLLLCLHCVLSTVCVNGDQTFKIMRPTKLRTQFNYLNVSGSVYAEPSLFGLAKYQAGYNGILKRDLTNNNLQGCNPYSPGFVPTDLNGASNRTTIAFVQRGGCSFGQKAIMAQNAQCAAIIVYDTTGASQLPKMSGGTDTPNINIPGMIITTDASGPIITQLATWEGTPIDSNAVWVALSYSLIAPDDRVEFDLFTYPDEVAAAQFVTQFADVVTQLGSAAYFTPHYRIMNGDDHGCTPLPGDSCLDPNNLPCGSQCTNCGRYCRLDPNQDLNTRPDGADEVYESTIAKCVWMHSDAAKDPTNKWWAFVNYRANTLKCNSEVPYRGSTCSDDAMTAVGLSDDDIASIKACAGKTGQTDDFTNSLLESEMAWITTWSPLTSPYLYVNNITYYGGYTCPAPAGPETCGPLSMICQGYKPGTAPALCGFLSNGCDPGVNRDACGICGGAAIDGDSCDSKSSFPVGPVIGVAIVCCILIGGAVYWYMRRQNLKMKDDIDSLLKQYLPLDGQTNGGSSNGKHGRQTEPSNLRLIGNVDSSDEPTDL